MTSDQQPTKDWLDFVRHRARARAIRAYLRSEQRERSIAARHASCSSARCTSATCRSRAAQERRARKVVETLHRRRRRRAVRGSRLRQDRARRRSSTRSRRRTSRDDEKSAPPALCREARCARSRKRRQRRHRDQRHRRRARALRQVLQPAARRSIIGFITRGRGVTVHRRGCKRRSRPIPSAASSQLGREGEDRSPGAGPRRDGRSPRHSFDRHRRLR